MPSSFPSSPDNIQNNVANSTTELDTHPNLHNKLADAVNAVEAALLPGGTMNLAAHLAAADPHAVYLTQTEGDARYSTIAGGIPDGSITSAKIADGTIQAQDIADGAITSIKIADGGVGTNDIANFAIVTNSLGAAAVTTAKIADGAVTNAKLASDTARANLLTNGSFDVWQRGPGPFSTNGVYSADRWDSNILGTDTLSISRSTTVDTGSAFSAACTFTLGSGGGSTRVEQVHHTTEFTGFPGRTLSFSMRVRTSTPSAVRISINNYYGSADHYTYSSFHSGGGGWETLSVPAVAIDLTAAYVIVTVQFHASCTAYLDNAMLVVGSVPADYAPLHPADDLARCLRYYEQVGGAAGLFASMWCITATNAVGPVMFKVSKAVTPTVTVQGGWSVQFGGGSTSAFTTHSPSAPTLQGFTYQGNGAAGLTVGQGAALLAAGAASLLIAEANP